jgi:hypothetical protein
MRAHRLLGLGLVASAAVFAATASHANAPAGRYTTPVTGVVYDTKTKLTWQAGFGTSTAWGSASTSGTAQAICAALTIDGGKWRLPTVTELQSLVDYSQQPNSAAGVIDSTFFPGTPGVQFWASTPLAGVPNNAWYVSFYDGSTATSLASSGYDVRCVK